MNGQNCKLLIYDNIENFNTFEWSEQSTIVILEEKNCCTFTLTYWAVGNQTKLSKRK